MSKYTSGPWFVEYDTDTIRNGEQSTDGLNPNSHEVPLNSDNMRLMAAAPELLEACKAALDTCTDDVIRGILNDAIDKAEGKE